MKIEIKNVELERVIIFLEKTNFKGMQSVNRSKVTNFLSEQLVDVIKGEKTIIEELKDDEKELQKELEKYLEQTVTVEGANYQAGLVAIKNKIKELTSDDSEQEFSGNDAFVLAVLYEAFELDKEEK